MVLTCYSKRTLNQMRLNPTSSGFLPQHKVKCLMESIYIYLPVYHGDFPNAVYLVGDFVPIPVKKSSMKCNQQIKAKLIL